MIIEVENLEEYLSHFGVKGMKWGVRKDRIASSDHLNKDFKQNSNVYRILAKSGSRDLKDLAYVSTNDIDNNRYIHILNHTISARLFKEGRYETQLVLGPKVPLKAPSIKRTEEEIQKLYESNPVMKQFVKDNELYFGTNPDTKRLTQIVNTALVDDDVLFTGAVAMRQEVKRHFQSKGYNSLLDMNDIKEGLAKTPLIVFDPEKTLSVVSKTEIDETIKQAATKLYKDTKKSGYT